MRHGIRNATLVLALAVLSAPVMAQTPPAAPEAAGSGSADRGDSYYEYCLSRQALYRHDFMAAIDYLRKAQEADPGSIELTLELARLHLDLDQPDEAARVARRAIDLDPDAAEPRHVLAQALLVVAQREGAGDDEYKEALDAWRAFLDRQPDDAEGWLNVAKLLMARGAPDEALEALHRHLTLAPTSDEGVYLTAQVLMKLDRYDEARQMLETAARKESASPQFLLALSDVYERQGDLEDAVKTASRLLDMQVDPLRVHFILARLNQKMGRHVDAFDHLSRMAAIMDARPTEFNDVDRAEIQLRMIRALIQAGRTDDAIRYADTGAQRFPDDLRFGMRKGEALLLADRGREADKVFKTALKDHADNKDVRSMVSDAYLSAGASREEAGDVTGAESHLRRSIELNPENGTALNYLGYMLADRGERLDEAIGYIKRALEREPDNGAYLDSLGWAYFKKGDYKQSEVALESAVEAMGDEAEIHAHLGDLYFAIGRTEDAVKAWQAALDRGAENADEIRARLAAVRKAADPAP